MLMVNCGYTYEYIDNYMTIPKLAALTRYWADVPPLDAVVSLIAARLGIDIGSKKEEAPAEVSESGTPAVTEEQASAFMDKWGHRGSR